MKLLEQIDRHEVLRKWAIGEVYSQFFTPENDMPREEVLTMLLSGNREYEKKGIESVLEFKQGLVDSISINIRWFRALLETGKSDLDLIYTLQLPGWKRNTAGSYLISEAARNIQKFPNLDRRVSAIHSAYKAKNVSLDGITLLAVDRIGPYVAVEGTGRLTSIYISKYLEASGNVSGNIDKIQVILGLY